MGYTHYWTYRPQEDPYHQAWPILVAGTRTIVETVLSLGIRLAGPDGSGEPVINITRGIAFNGITGAPGALSQEGEPFRLDPPEPEPHEGRRFAFCKTLRRPYDLAVTAVLLRARLLLGEDFTLASDGTWDGEWAHGSTSPSGSPVAPVGRLFSARALHHELFGDAPTTNPLIHRVI